MGRYRCQGCFCCCLGCHLRLRYVPHDRWCCVRALEGTGLALKRCVLACVTVRDVEFDDDHFVARHRLCHTMYKLPWLSCNRASDNGAVRTQVPILETKRCVLLLCRIGDNKEPSLSDSCYNGELFWDAMWQCLDKLCLLLDSIQMHHC